MGDVKRALIVPDCHIPFEDKRAYEIMLNVAKDVDPDEIVILGDYADIYGVNSHGKDPEIKEELRDEVMQVCMRLRELKDLFPRSRKIYIEGNHEYRLARFIKNKAPELFGCIKVEDILHLDKYGFEFIPYGPNQQYNVLGSKLIARHEPLSGGLHCAHGTVSKAMKSVIFGHTHRIQESQIVTLDGDNYRGISSGWLGDKDHPVMGYVKNHHQWALGFSIVTVLPDGTWFNQLIHIIDYKCVFDGNIYEQVPDKKDK